MRNLVSLVNCLGEKSRGTTYPVVSSQNSDDPSLILVKVPEHFADLAVVDVHSDVEPGQHHLSRHPVDVQGQLELQDGQRQVYTRCCVAERPRLLNLMSFIDLIYNFHRY